MPVTREGVCSVCSTEAEVPLREAVVTIRNSGPGLSGIPCLSVCGSSSNSFQILSASLTAQLCVYFSLSKVKRSTKNGGSTMECLSVGYP